MTICPAMMEFRTPCQIILLEDYQALLCKAEHRLFQIHKRIQKRRTKIVRLFSIWMERTVLKVWKYVPSGFPMPQRTIEG